MLPRPVVVGIAVLVSLMWAVNLTVGFLYPGRSDPYVNAIFGMVVSAVLVLARKPGSRGDRDLRQRLADAIAPPDEPDREEPPASDEEAEG